MRHRRAKLRQLISPVLALALAMSVMVVGSSPSQAVNVAHGAIVNPDPANFTPNVLDGQVNAIVQIGTKVYVGGLFTQVQASSGGTIHSRSNLFSFNATTGVIDTAFAPTFDKEVKALALAPDGNLLVGGYFTSVNGDTNVRRLVKLNPTTGIRIPAFSANPNSQVWDMVVRGNTLYVGGRFTTIKGVARERLAAVDVTTGAVSPNLNIAVTETHVDRDGATPWVYSMDVSPDGSKLVLIGNFMRLDGLSRPQAGMIDLSTTPATVANWQTDRYEHPCFDGAFITYMRDIDFSPNGSYFVIVTTGGPNFGTLCDTAARWETDATGAGLEPSWIDATGGDTLSSVAVTGTAVYTGGHQRWMNNWFGGDFPGPGAVERPGIAALDPENGLPFSWNPTKDRGVGVFALYSTAAGLWMGSDTDKVAGEFRRKLAFFPIAGGSVPPPTNPYSLPGDLYNVPISACPQVDTSILYRVNTGGPEVESLDCATNWIADDVDGAPGDAFRNGGTNTVGSWGQQFTVDGTVPAATPATIFDSERWSPSDSPAMLWDFPVSAGTDLQVRLYFINQYSGTSGVGQRVFNVAIDGSPVLTAFDIVASVGDRVGTMRSFNITSDGNVDIDFSHVIENPLINGIEIVNMDVPPGPGPGPIEYLPRRSFDGATPGSTSNLNTPGVDWSGTRGIFALQGKVYYGSSDGNLYVRTFNGTTAGSAQQIDLNGISDIPVQSLTSLFYSDAQIYYTVKNDPLLYTRGFTTESLIVGADSWSVGSVDWSDVRGMTIANGDLYFARANGNLYSMDFADGDPDQGTEALVSPASAGYDWASRGLFLFTTIVPDTQAPTQPGKPTGSSPSAGSITINWAASQDPSPPITYSVYRDGNPTAIGTTTNTTFTDPGLVPGSSHTYTVDAVDGLNNGPSAMSLPSNPIVVASAAFADDFSSGDFSKWTSVTRLTIDGTMGGTAVPSARAQVTNQSAFAYKILVTPLSTICMSVKVNATSLGTGSPVLMKLRTAGNGALARVYANASGILTIKSDVSGVQQSSGVVLGSGWHTIEMCGTVGAAGEWDLYRDGMPIVTDRVLNTGTTPAGRVEIGDTSAKTMTINFDDVVVDQVAG